MNNASIRMKAIFAIVALLLAVSSALAAAQSATPAQPAPATATPAPLGPPVLVAKIAGTLSSKTAKVGDPITAKTISTLKLKDGVEIPRGSRIIGSVAEVKSAQDGGGTSSLAIKIDQVEMKEGKFMRIAGLITAIGPVPDTVGLGYGSVLGRGGVGSTVGLDPSVGADAAVNRGDPDIPRGSTLEGIKLNNHLNADRATELRGVKRDIKLDSTVMIKVALYRTSAG